MNRRNVCLTLLLLLLAGCLQAAAQKKENSFASPDFAFPQTVAENARQELDESLKDRAWQRAVQALVQLTLADDVVSADSLQSSIRRVDGVAAQMPSPWREVTLTLEAALYSRSYSKARYAVDARQPLAGKTPEDMREWDKEMYAREIMRLCGEATGLPGNGDGLRNLSRLPVADVAPLLEPTAEMIGSGGYIDYKSSFPSAAFVVAGMFVDYLKPFAVEGGVLPFGASDGAALPLSSQVSELRGSLVDALSSYAVSDDSRVEAALMKADLLGQEEGRRVVTALRDSLSSSTGALRLTFWLLNNPADDNALRSLIEQGRAEVKRYAASPFAAEVERKIASLTQPFLSLESRGQYLTTDSISARVTLENISAQRLLLVKVASGENNIRLGTVRSKGKVVGSVLASCVDTVPFRRSVQMDFPPVGAGTYCVLPSADATLAGVPASLSATMYVPLISVSDISLIFEKSSLAGVETKGYVVEGKGQKPVAGASVRLERRNGSTVTDTRTCTSGADGSFVIPRGDNRSWIVTATSGASRCVASLYDYVRSTPGKSYSTHIYTDLALYRPGAEVRFVCVTSCLEGSERRLSVPTAVRAELRDASGERVDTLTLRIAPDGRSTGSFPIPEGRLNGSWSIRTVASCDGVQAAGNVWFQVGEYKTPKFYVEMDSIASDCKAGMPLLLKGRAMTYSGMPVAGAAVELTVKTVIPWWRPVAMPQASYTVNAVTDAEGCFSVSLSTDRFVGSSYASVPLSVTAQATDAAGETQASEPLTFSLSEAITLISDIPAVISTESDTQLTVRVVDGAGSDVGAEVGYELTALSDNRVVAQGVFTSPAVPLSVRTLAPGRYKAVFRAGDASCEATFTLYDPQSEKVPCAVPLWLNPVERADGKARLRFGSGYAGSWLLVMVSGDKGVVSREWVRSDGDLKELTLELPAAGERLYVNISAMHNLTADLQSVQILSDEEMKKSEIETVSFRDRLLPGAKERWSFRFSRGGTPEANSFVIATMTDKALNQITPFRWMIPGISVNRGNPCYLAGTLPGSVYDSFSLATGVPSVNAAVFSAPSWYWYGVPFSSGVFMQTRQMMYKSAAVNADSVTIAEAAGVVEDLAAEAGNGAAADADREEESFPALRADNCPVAFFYPLLTTDGEGIVEISFDVPDYNTTWALQLLACDAEMHGALGSFEAVASKPVMVSCNAPRFLRVGDVAALRMTAFNNSGADAPVAMRMEIVEPISGEVIAAKDFPAADMTAGASRTEEMTFTVPEGTEAIAVRSYATLTAAGHKHTDGEQALVAVLPAAEPVVESVPFWIAPDAGEVSVRIPDMKSGDSAWLTYCNNPVWTCVTALPDITSDPGNSVTGIAAAIYGQSVAAGIADRFPQVRKALGEWMATADSALISPLLKNTELKAIALASTPWGGSARAESLRMLRLGRLLEKDMTASRMKTLVRSLLNLQSASGGFSWCPGMEPSLFATSVPLLCAGLSRSLGYGPDDASLGKALARAVTYCDRELYARYVENKKSFYMPEMLSWLYIRSLYPEVAESGNFAELRRKALAAVEEDWRTLDIYDAATAAIVLHRAGRTATAAQILESLSQKASRSEARGCWFDNLSSRGAGYGKLTATAQALQAFAEISPESDMTAGLRQWLILQRQAEDWGSRQMLAGVVNAVLTCGPEWFSAEDASFALSGGRTLQTPRGEAYTGEFTMALDPKETGGALLTVRKAGPQSAWGAVLTRRELRPEEVKSSSTQDVAIEKRLYRKVEKSGATVYEEVTDGALSVGEEVRVVLTITATRDIEYVAVTDSRSACLEPVGQLSGYRSGAGLWYYEAITDSSTDFFISFLPKGVSQISYDCHADRAGNYSLGIATLQSEYAPAITAHSAGSALHCR